MAQKNGGPRAALWTGYGVISLFIAVTLAYFFIAKNAIADTARAIDLTAGLFGLFTVHIVLLSGILEHSGDKKSLSLMRLVFFTGVELFLDMTAFVVDGKSELVWLNILSNTLLYIGANLLALFFWHYLKAELQMEGEKYHRLSVCVHVLILLSALAAVLNLFFGWYFTVTPEGLYIRQPYFPLCFLSSVAVMGLCAWGVLTRPIQKREKALLLSYELYPLIAIVFQYFYYGLSLIYPSMVLSILVIRSTVHLHRREALLRQEIKLSEQNTAIMISQIQPHFLYNSLTTISNLCRKDPETAEEATVMFSRYLRMNLDSVRNMAPVPFAKEKEHTDIYLRLEKMRFGDRLNIVEDIRETNFLLPALSLQPVAENSVKHGLCAREEGGTLTISTRRVPGGVELVVADDGVGFDPSAPVKDDGRSHVGMSNVRDRLKSMCGAHMRVESSPGHGCVTTIFIPDKEKR